MVNKCAICSTPATKICSGCQNVAYCNREHQILDWKNGHKLKCKCFEIRQNETLGRHWVAKRNIKKGELIHEEAPTVFGPKAANDVMCLGCSQTIHLNSNQKNYYKCSKCTWPLCGPKCESSPCHVDECELMARKKYKCSINYNDSNNKKESSYCIIVPLRIMLLKRKNPKFYESIMSLESHLEERESSQFYSVMRANLVPFINGFLGLTEFDANTIMSIAGVLDTNSFEIRLPNKNVNKIRAIYIESCMLSHDCKPNTKHVFRDDMKINLIATVDIKKDEIISISYTQSLKNTLTRRLHLKSVKCFDCTCQRCSDASEFGTYAGSIVCLQCKNDKMISTNPLDNDADWLCPACNEKLSGRDYREYYGLLWNEMMSIDKRSPDAFEKYLAKYEDILHPTNSYTIEVKYALTQLYGNVKDLTDDVLERKIVLCRELLEISNALEPGWNRFRGNLLLDYQEILLIQTERLLAKKVIGMGEAKVRAKDSLIHLNEAVDILKVESDLEQMVQHKTRILLNFINSI